MNELRLARPALAAALFGAACVAGIPAFAEDRQILVIQSSTGPAAFAGVPALNGMRLAIDEINADGFLGAGNTLAARIEDDGGDRNQTFAIVNRHAVGNPDLLALLGPTGVAVGIPTGGLINQLKLPMLAFANGSSILETGPYTFMSHEGAATSTPILAKHAFDQGARRCGVAFAIDNDAYVTQTRAFETAFKELGGAISDEIEMRTSDSDFAAATTRLASGGHDCLFVATPAAPAANFVRQLRTAGLDPETPIYGSTSMVSVDFLKIGGSAVEGVTMLGDWAPQSSQLSIDFIKGYTDKFGVEPDNWAAVGYTMAYVLASAIRDAGDNPTRDSVREALAATADVPVILGTGSYSYDPATRLPLHGAILMTIKDGDHVVVDQ